MHANVTRQEKGMKTAITSIFLNLFLSGVKFCAGLLGNSYALMADGIESLLDIFSSTVVWGGLRIGSLPPDNNHPFGHGRAESLAAMIVSGVLLAVGTGIAAQSVLEILSPQHAPASFTLFVLVGVVIIKEGLYRSLLKIGEEINSLSVVADAWHNRSDALTSLAAFIGISIALVGGKGYESADDWAALFASGIIFYNGFKMLRTAAADIMDTAIPSEFENMVRTIAQKVPHVSGVDKCRIRKSGLDYFVEIHIVVDGSLTVSEGHDIAHHVKHTLLGAGLHVADVMTHVEPG